MLEILSPAGSPEGVIAAVQNGADAVYLGFGDFNARRNAKNFTTEDFAKAAEYCRVRGVKVHVTLNTLGSDRELPHVCEAAKTAARLGADAFIVQDLGVMRALRHVLPDMPLHASTQMSIHNLEGAKLAAAMGMTRVVLARELSRREIALICERAPIETEVFAHGALCMSYSGQCYMSSVIGRRSGNRGLCAQPCRMNYQADGQAGEYLLSLKDLCLAPYLEELAEMGVTAVKIEGRMKRPEYAAIVTGIYSKVARSGRPPTEADMKALAAAFSREGFTDGYYTGRKGRDMFGVRTEEDKGESVVFSTARKNYLNGEFQRVPVRFAGMIRKGEPAKIAAMDDRGNTARAEGPVPEPAFHRELSPTILQTQLHKTGGTPFYCDGVRAEVDRGLSLSAAAMNEMRRDVLAALMESRKAFTPPAEGEFSPGFHLLNREEPPALTVSVARLSQLSPALAERAPAILYIPAEELVKDPRPLRPFLENGHTQVALRLPPIIHDNERGEVEKMLKAAAALGISDALSGNLGQLQFCRQLGFNVRGDYGLNVYNAQTLRVLKDLGLSSATASFELRLAEVRDLSKCLDTELIAYGRLPLMITENCVAKTSRGVCACDNFSGLRDRQGVSFPVMREFGHRNVLLNSKKLFLADRWDDLCRAGLWACRLMFTTENERECVQIMDSYSGLSDYAPGGYTRGLYYRGVL